jgi:hypothetical protein
MCSLATSLLGCSADGKILAKNLKGEQLKKKIEEVVTAAEEKEKQDNKKKK